MHVARAAFLLLHALPAHECCKHLLRKHVVDTIVNSCKLPVPQLLQNLQLPTILPALSHLV